MPSIAASFGYFLNDYTTGGEFLAVWISLTALLGLTLGYLGARFWMWTIFGVGALWGFGASQPIWIAFGAIAALGNLPPLRRLLVTSVVFGLMKKFNFIPKISETERVALKAGNVWMEGELFSGKPRFERLLSQKYPKLTPEEQAFVDGPVETVCKMISDWDVWKQGDLPREVWDFLKKERFFGMIIPKEYGGLGFSAMAHSEVIMKLASRSIPACITAMVPNSLGPAELLNHYGTDAQKKYYLPRLARGEDIPCFALTEPNAGSDAGSIQSHGVVFKGDDGKLYLKLNWNKRWITLAAVSTVVGLAFRLKDPQNLLGKGEDAGITCALVPAKTPGVILGRRHDPLGVPFFNCPTQGRDVVVPIDAIIGGPEMAGKGWQMLMESLAAGRGISLPAQSTGGVKTILRVASAHATVRRQFGISIGKFEGIAEPLARLGGYAYLMEAARRYTLGGIDSGQKPPVVTAIMKYQTTELGRKAINDGMDIQGGQGISRGPRNLLAHAYMASPIGITVEGANILTRTLIIFGQGALRAHPYAFHEVDAVEEGDLKRFDWAFWKHVGHVARNACRTLVLSLSRGYFALPARGGVTLRYYQRLSWTSASFAFMADLAMGLLGGQLKTREKITGRFADILSWMYLGTATLKRFEEEGCRKEDVPVLHWAMRTAFNEIQKAFDGIFANFDVPWVGWIFKGPVATWSRFNTLGYDMKDSLDFEIAARLQDASGLRERLSDGIYIPNDFKKEQFARLENAFRLTLESEVAFKKVRKALKEKKLKKAPMPQVLQEALRAGVLSQPEYDVIERAEAARNDAIQVDDYSLAEYAGRSQSVTAASA